MNHVVIRVIFDRKKMATKTKPATIELEVTANARRRFKSSGVKVCKGQFKAGRVCNRDNSAELNKKIDAQIRQIEEMVQAYNEQHLLWTVADLDHVDDELRSADANFIDWMEKRIMERELAPGTRKHHLCVVDFLRKHTGIYSFRSLNPENITRMDDYLHQRNIGTPEEPKRMNQTTIRNYHKVLKHYISDAILFGYMDKSPYDRIHIERGKSAERTVLTLAEIDLVHDYSTTSILDRKVRDLFMVQCYTGLAFMDLMKMDFSKRENINGVWLLRDVRQKTGEQFYITLLPRVLEVLERYGGSVPHLAYDVYNRNLKAVVKAAGVAKHVTTHIGRHTFATTIALGSGVPIEVLAKMMGHSDIKTTQIYAKIQPDAVTDGFSRIASKI